MLASLLLFGNHGHVNELDIPPSWIQLLALFIDRRRDNYLYDLDVIFNRLRRERTVTHYGHEIFTDKLLTASSRISPRSGLIHLSKWFSQFRSVVKANGLRLRFRSWSSQIAACSRKGHKLDSRELLTNGFRGFPADGV